MINNVEAPVELIKVGENAYAMRDWNFQVKFEKNNKTGKKELVQVLRDKTIRSQNPVMGKEEKTPLEQILDGNFEKGVEAYQKAKKEDTNHEQLSEGFLNGTGYALLRQKDFTRAIDVFRVNTILYPKAKTHTIV
ncbi:tetratricopeptide repeat protein [Chryseobacterium tongliaoense]|uniref:tetratricopeptide repeat protein n=1 Tax=Chryseobacterium tongliaoense TaxID=3240933 RepID=UPI0035138B64